MKDKNIVEKQFDEMLSTMEKKEYCFDAEKLRGKDRQIIRILNKINLKGKKCLDVGPGTGRFIKYFKSASASFIAAADISNESLSRCKNDADKLQKLNVESDSLDFEDNTFDIIISFEVLEHLLEPNNYLSEMVRVANKNAIIIMSVPNTVSLISRIRMIVGLLPVAIAADKTHVAFYRKKDIKKLFSKFSLKPHFLPTSISLNIFNPKSKISIPSCKFLSGFDDSLLFYLKVNK